jgi:hypothetical protein
LEKAIFDGRRGFDGRCLLSQPCHARTLQKGANADELQCSRPDPGDNRAVPVWRRLPRDERGAPQGVSPGTAFSRFGD